MLLLDQLLAPMRWTGCHAGSLIRAGWSVMVGDRPCARPRARYHRLWKPGARHPWRRGPLAPQAHDPGLLSAYMPSRDQVVSNGPRLVWLGSLGLGVADRQAGTRVEKLQVRRVDSELDLMAGRDRTAGGHPRGPECLPGRQRHGCGLVVLCCPRGAEPSVLDGRSVDPEQNVHLAAECLGDVRGSGDARPGRVRQLAVLEVRRPDPED